MKKHCLWFATGVAALLVNAARGEIVYDNSSDPEGLFHDSRLEAGDEITLAGEMRYITDFSFEYYSEFTSSGDETARLRFYLLDGAPGGNDFPTPGTLLYDSAPISIVSGYGTVEMTELGVLIPGNEFAWTVQFSGIAANESAGLIFYNPPAVGSSDNYFWEKENGDWLALAYDESANNFAARVTATNAPAVLRISNVTHSNGTATLTATGAVSGNTYALEYKNSLASAAAWERVPGQVTATGESVTLADESAGAVFRFYRVVQEN